MHKAIAVVTLGFLVTISTALAQTNIGEIRGRVTDPNGAVIPGAKVLLSSSRNAASGISRGTTTNSEGEYSFESLPLGTYELTVSITAFARTFTKRVELTSNQLLKVGVVFSFAACSDEQETAAETKLSETDHAEIVRVIISNLLGVNRQPPEKKKVILSPDNFSQKWLLPEQSAQISIFSRDKIQEITEQSGELVYYTLTKPVQRGGCVAISLLNNWTVKGQIEDANMAGGADNYEVRKVNGKWIALLLSSEIS